MGKLLLDETIGSEIDLWKNLLKGEGKKPGLFGCGVLKHATKS